MYHECQCGCGITFHSGPPNATQHAKAVLLEAQRNEICHILRQSYYHSRESVRFWEIAGTIMNRWNDLQKVMQ